VSQRAAVIYARVSTDEQAANYSLPHQESVCRAWCKRHGISIAAVFIDAGESGKDLERPEFLAMEAHLDRGDIGWVVVTKIDRLTRSVADLSELVQAWEDSSIVLRAIEDGFDTPRADGNRLLLLFQGLMGQWERQRIVARVIPGLQARAAAGLPLGRAPFGYRSGPSGWVPDPETAPLVRMIFERAAVTGEGSRRLADWISAQSGRRLSYGTVGGLLRNPVYLGNLRLTVGAQTTSHEDCHEPLIDLATWLHVQSLAKTRSAEREEGTAHSHAKSWLGGIARCGQCGAKVYMRQRETGDGVYLCHTSLQGQPCGAAAWPQGPADTFVWDLLQMRLLADLDLLRTFVNGVIDAIPTVLDAQHEKARTIAAEAETAQARLVDDFALGVIDQAAFEDRMAHWHTRRQEADQLIRETDGWRFLGRLASFAQVQPSQLAPAVQEALNRELQRRQIPDGHAFVMLPFALVLARMSMPERRQLLEAVAERVELIHAQPTVRVIMRSGIAAYARLGQTMSLAFAQGDGLVAVCHPAKPQSLYEVI